MSRVSDQLPARVRYTTPSHQNLNTGTMCLSEALLMAEILRSEGNTDIVVERITDTRVTALPNQYGVPCWFYSR